MNNTAKGSVASWTMRVSAAVMAAGGYIAANPEALKAVMTPEVFGLTMLGLGAVMAALRIKTTTPLNERADK